MHRVISYLMAFGRTHFEAPLSINICSLLLCLSAVASPCFGQGFVEEQKRTHLQEAQSLLFQFNDQVKAVDEPTLRIFLRLRYATLLWSGKVGAASEKAEDATADAINDFST